jgi:hypothetical protein
MTFQLHNFQLGILWIFSCIACTLLLFCSFFYYGVYHSTKVNERVIDMKKWPYHLKHAPPQKNFEKHGRDDHIGRGWTLIIFLR